MEGAYGSGKAGAPFDFISFIKKPEVIVRLVAILFAIIVFGCISSRGHGIIYTGCLYGDENACNYGIGIGVLAFVICIVFLILDACFQNISGVNHRRYVVMADIGISTLWCFLWFVGFCYLTNKWTTSGKNIAEQTDHGFGVNDLQAAIAFSFFSIITWGVLVALAVLKYRKGVSESSDGVDRPDIAQSSNPYASFGGEVDQSYQTPPFQTGSSQAPPSQYQPPTY